MSDLKSRNEAFRQAIAMLNPEQKRVVEHTEGPVLTIAGPGSGKTHMLAARVGQILLHTDTPAQAILCLTFTDAGATAMRSRLLSMLGPEAYRIPIYTFHSFCNRVIQDNPERFGNAALEPLSDLERAGMIRQLLEELPPDNPLRAQRKDPFTFAQHVAELLQTMKAQNWKPGDLRREADRFIRSLPSRVEYQYRNNSKYGQKGQPKKVAIDDMVEKMERLKAAADLYPRFQTLLEKAGRYEFDDMLQWVLRAFEKHPALLRNYQERYLYFLVDEYQDTNGAQHELLRQLIAYWDKPNVFVVGDDDQSIYEFQGARLQNILQFYADYRSDLFVEILRDNYRSSGLILKAAERLIAHNTLRLAAEIEDGIEKTQRAVRGDGHEPRILRYADRNAEWTDIVAQIETLIAQGAPPDEIAIIYAKHRQGEPFLRLLESRRIPAQTKRPANALDTPIIQQTIELLRYIYDEYREAFSGEHRLFALLHAPFWGHEPLELARFALRNRQAREAGETLFWRENWRPQAGAPTEFDLNDLIRVAGEAQTREGIGFGERVLLGVWQASGILQYTLRHPDKAWLLQVLSAFRDFVAGEERRSPQLTLAQFLRLIDDLRDNQIPIPTQRQIGDLRGVRLLTAHAAKGLEFAHVFMPDCRADAWERQGAAGRRRFTLPDTLTRAGEADFLEARRRLFFVAMTRAKDTLAMSYAASGPDGKTLDESQFLHETGISITEAPLTGADPVLAIQSALLASPTPERITLPHDTLITPLLESLVLTPSSFNRYLRCPLAFYYEDILAAPLLTSPAAAYCDAMHWALQQYLNAWRSAADDAATPPLEMLLAYFETAMTRRQHFFSPTAYIQRLAFGREALMLYHQREAPFLRRKALAEWRIDRVHVGQAPIKGVIDKIEWLDARRIRIVDYKTGNPDKTRLAKPDERQPYGGVYRRQLAFYQILIERSHMFSETIDSCMIQWLDPDKNRRLDKDEIRFEAAEIRMAEALIEKVWNKIQAREFDFGCGQDTCSWCALQAQGRYRPEEERLEDGLDEPR